MKTLRTRLSLLLAVGVLSVAACGGGGGDGAGSNVDSAKPLSDLTEEESRELCEYSAQEFDVAESQAAGCQLLALLLSDSPESCQASYDSCMAEEDTVDCSTESLDPEELPDCAANVTVGEMEACVEARFDQMVELTEGLSCSSDPGEASFPSSLPAICEEIEEKCPELFEDEE